MEFLSILAGQTQFQKTLMIIAVILLVCAELWCIYVTVYTLRKQSIFEDPSLFVFFLSLHLTLILRIIQEISNSYNIPQHWRYYLLCFPIITKDTVICVFALRYFEAILSFCNDQDEARNGMYPQIIKWTYIGLFIHFVIYFTFFILETIGIFKESTVVQKYEIVIHIILLCEFVYAGVSFSIARQKMDEESRKSVISVWLSRLLIYMIFVNVYRIAGFLMIIIGVFSWLEFNHPAGYSINMSLFSLFTEIIPCILITFFLFRVSIEIESEEEDEKTFLT